MCCWMILNGRSNFHNDFLNFVVALARGSIWILFHKII